MTVEVAALARAGLRNPRQIKVTVQGAKSQGVQATPATLTNSYIVCDESRKMLELVKFLEEHAESKIMLYVLTCAFVDYFSRLLPLVPRLKDIHFDSLHGKMVQKRRSKTYETFGESKKGVLICTDVAARGLDIPDVDWIVQYDAPQDPSFFIHRVGRTARFGRSGHSVLLLAPHEDTYVEFLSVRKVPIKAEEMRGTGEEAAALAASMQAVSVTDLDLHEHGQRALVSYVRGYKEHQCHYIFQENKLKIGGIAMSMGLLRLPRMPEMKGLDAKGFFPATVDIHQLTYKDKAREAARKVRVDKKNAEYEATKEERGEQKKQRLINSSWSVNKKTIKKEEVKKKKKGNGKFSDSDSAEESESDADDFQAEARMLKKLKKGEITQAQYDAATAGGSGEDSD